MSLINPQLPKQYKNSKVLYEQNLDAWRVAAEAAFATVNLNLTQLRKDCFLATYDFDNDGNANLPKSLQQQINDLSTGATPIAGTTADSWIINSDGNSVTLSSAGLTAPRTFTFPDLSGQIVTTNATQTLTNKTLTAPTINAPTITNPTVTGVLVVDQGLAGTPSIAYSGDLNTGFYSPVADSIAITLGGIQTFLYTATYTQSINPFYFATGAETAPSATFGNDTNSGLYSAGVDTIGVTLGGTASFLFSTGASISRVPFYAPNGSAANPSYSFENDADLGIYRAGANSMAVSVGGVQTFIFDATNTFSVNPFYLANGAVGAPSLSFLADPNSGIYSIGADSIGIATNGVLGLTISNTEVAIGTGRQLLIQDGTAGSPGFAFGADTNNGIYRSAADTWHLVANSTAQVDITDGIVDVNTRLKVPANSPPSSRDDVTAHSTVKFYANFNIDNAGAVLIPSSYNITSIAQQAAIPLANGTTATGYRISFDTVFTGAGEYAASINVEGIDAAGATGAFGCGEVYSQNVFDMHLFDDDDNILTVSPGAYNLTITCIGAGY